MTSFDVFLLGVIATVLAKDIGPKITGYFNAKKGGVSETPIAPYISEKIRFISHGIFTLVFFFLILQFNRADFFTMAFFITLVLTGIFPQNHGVYEKGLKAKGHFYRWEEIEKITIPRKSVVFHIKLKRKFRFGITFSVSMEDREKLIEALNEKPVNLKIQ